MHREGNTNYPPHSHLRPRAGSSPQTSRFTYACSDRKARKKTNGNGALPRPAAPPALLRLLPPRCGYTIGVAAHICETMQDMLLFKPPRNNRILKPRPRQVNNQ